MDFVRPEKDPEFKKVDPEPIYQFRKLSPSDPISLPELAKNRNLTDIIFLVVFGIGILILIIWTIYILATTTINTLLHGLDECGNICGTNNHDVLDKKDCKATDYSEYPVLLFEQKNERIVGTTCIKTQDCDKSKNRELFVGHCFPVGEAYYGDIGAARYRVLSIWTQVALCLLEMLAFSILGPLLLYVCFRLHVVATLYVVLVTAFVLSLGGTIIFWVLFALTLDYILILPAVYCTVSFIILVCLVVKLRKRFRLVTALFREATEIIFKSPLLLVVPLLTSAFFLAIFFASLYLKLQSTAGITEVEDRVFATRVCFIVILCIMEMWIVTVVDGCQCMIVAGTTTAYYFSKDKSTLHRPFFTSMFITLRFHLGTIAFGSLVIYFLKGFRKICDVARGQTGNIVGALLLPCVECMLGCIEDVLYYLCTKAYLMTSIHGRGLFTSGKRGMRLLWHFLLDTIVVDALSSTVMLTAALLILFVAATVGYFIMKPAVVSCFPADYDGVAAEVFMILTLGMCSITCGFVLIYFISVMSITVETLFLCFCEDQLLNDGSAARPYFVSKGLQEVMTGVWELAAKERADKELKRVAGSENE